MKTIEFTEEELLLFCACFQRYFLSELYFDPPLEAAVPLLKVLNEAEKVAYCLSSSLSSSQTDRVVDLLFQYVDKFNDRLGTYKNIQTIRPKEGVPFWLPKTGISLK